MPRDGRPTCCGGQVWLQSSEREKAQSGRTNQHTLRKLPCDQPDITALHNWAPGVHALSVRGLQVPAGCVCIRVTWCTRSLLAARIKPLSVPLSLVACYMSLWSSSTRRKQQRFGIAKNAQVHVLHGQTDTPWLTRMATMNQSCAIAAR